MSNINKIVTESKVETFDKLLNEKLSQQEIKQTKVWKEAQKELLEELIKETETIVVNGKPVSTGMIDISNLKKHYENKLGK